LEALIPGSPVPGLGILPSPTVRANYRSGFALRVSRPVSHRIAITAMESRIHDHGGLKQVSTTATIGSRAAEQDVPAVGGHGEIPHQRIGLARLQPDRWTGSASTDRIQGHALRRLSDEDALTAARRIDRVDHLEVRLRLLPQDLLDLTRLRLLHIDQGQGV